MEEGLHFHDKAELILPLALVGPGKFHTMNSSNHTPTKSHVTASL